MQLIVKVASLFLFALVFFLIADSADAESKDNIIIGLDADMSSGTAEGGESIRRGAMIAINEINQNGGLLGRKIELIVRDHRGNPARGRDNILEFAEMDNVVAVLGGVHTPVAMHELKDIHAKEMIYLSPWAAGTPVVDNGYNPNYVFRVSVRDAFAGGFMVKYASSLGYNKIGLLLERTGWGRSNEAASVSALSEIGEKPIGIEWFNWGTEDMKEQISRLVENGAEALFLVANPREGGVVVKSMASLNEKVRRPIISHWGISGGDFFQDNKEALKNVDLSFLQTFSFFKAKHPDRAEAFFQKMKRNYDDIQQPEDVLSPVGAAHAYDLVHLLAKAIKQAQSLKRPVIREALENIEYHSGLMKDYAPPFTSNRHDALNRRDFIMTYYDSQGIIRPVGSMKNGNNTEK